MADDFIDLGIGNDLVKVLNQNFITEPTPIQKQTIPLLLDNKDVIGQAQTGTGKTIAFTLPIITKIDPTEQAVQALIVTPTRELALQVTGEVNKLGAAKKLNVLAVYGGQDIEQQIRRLKRQIHVVIGTPGRLIDHLNRGTLDFSRLKMLVLDEADQMLDMGFIKDVELIMRKTPSVRQTLLFSATMPAEIRALASRYMKEPVHVRTKSTNITLEEIRQIVYETTDRKKQEALFQLIDEHQPFLAIVFCRTKRRTAALNEALRRRGFSSDEIHGDVSQARREKVMKEFRNAKLQLLVATDVAARGLDVEGITHVFNYDIPKDAESYIHRIGRTGRAKKTGMAITLTTPYDQPSLDLIEKGIRMRLEKKKLIVKINEEHIPNKVIFNTGFKKSHKNLSVSNRTSSRKDFRRKPAPPKKRRQKAYA